MKKENTGNLLSCAVMGVLGLLLIIFRAKIDNSLYRIAGIGLLVAGGLGLIGGWSQAKSEWQQKHLSGGFAGAAAMTAVGIWVLCNPGGFKNTINFIVGAVLIVIGAAMLLQEMKSAEKRNMLLSGGIILAGIAVIVFKLVSSLAGWAIVGCGVALIYTAVTGAVSILNKKG